MFSVFGFIPVADIILINNYSLLDVTLSVAGNCNGIFKNIPVKPDGVFFVTDSRITFNVGQKEDIAPKLFKLSKYAGLVYSGNVGSATYIKKYLKRYFNENRLYDIKEIRYIFQKRYQKASEKGGDRTCQMMIGFFDLLENQTKVYHLSANSDNTCTYSELDGLRAIGSSEKVREKFIHDI
ncbi:MAG: hypothetical protein NWF07_11105 [Candidatus Bathyarchaeota archaeon]|nr:hypothetical protein [Candidatus Bathyarchaeota archaeon]